MSGLINGATPTGQQLYDDSIASLYAGPVDNSEFPINIRTTLNLSDESLSYWENMTCLFNREWYPSPDKATLPFCFFQITKYSEVDKTDVSKKRVILYEPPEEEEGSTDKGPITHGKMQVVVDNMVRHPKEYRMELVVPFMPFGSFAAHGLSVVNNVLKTFGITAGGGMFGESQTYIAEQMDKTFKMTDLANAVWNNQRNLVQEIGNSMNGLGMLNKNSLDAMYENGSILLFKTWMGYDDYKYVIITDKTAEKRGTEDDVWRVSLTVQEMPILSLAPVAGTVVEPKTEWVAATTDAQAKFILPIDGLSKNMPYFAEEE